MVVGKIMLLVGIVLDAVEFQGCALLHGHGFPALVADGPLLAGELPVERTAVGIDVLAVEQRRDVQAICF